MENRDLVEWLKRFDPTMKVKLQVKDENGCTIMVEIIAIKRNSTVLVIVGE